MPAFRHDLSRSFGFMTGSSGGIGSRSILPVLCTWHVLLYSNHWIFLSISCARLSVSFHHLSPYLHDMFPYSQLLRDEITITVWLKRSEDPDEFFVLRCVFPLPDRHSVIVVLCVHCFPLSSDLTSMGIAWQVCFGDAPIIFASCCSHRSTASSTSENCPMTMHREHTTKNFLSNNSTIRGITSGQ